jgi:hypothetical protein
LLEKFEKANKSWFSRLVRKEAQFA